MVADESNAFSLPSKSSPLDFQLRFHTTSRPGFLSIVIPVYNDVDGLTVTLRCLKLQCTAPEQFEIIVANDGGSREITTLCQRFEVKEVAIIPNGGAYVARNRAIEQASGEYIGLLDADVEAPPGWVKAALEAASRWDLVGGRIRLRVAERPSVVELYQMATLFPYERLVRQPRFLPTANIVVRRTVFETVGGFDPRLRSAGDSEFSDRVFRHGTYQLGISPEMEVIHPCRTYRQLLPRIKRSLYGHLNLFRLYGNRFDDTCMRRPSLFRLFFPNLSLYVSELADLKLGWAVRVRLFFFAWWMKLRTIPTLLSIRCHMAWNDKA